MKAMKQRARGFTIVELLIVIVVIGILAAITVVAFNGVQARAYEVKVSTTAKNYMKAILALHAQNGTLPGGYACLGSVQDYPAEDGWGEGQCFVSVWNADHGDHANGTYIDDNRTDSNGNNIAINTLLRQAGITGLSSAGIKPVRWDYGGYGDIVRGLEYNGGQNGSTFYPRITYRLPGIRDCHFDGYKELSFREILDEKNTRCVLMTSVQVN